MEALIAEHAGDCGFTEVINALMCLRGIRSPPRPGWPWRSGTGPASAAPHIGSYLGLVPSEHSSGDPPASQGPITKAGNAYARRLLVEAAWQHARAYAARGAAAGAV